MKTEFLAAITQLSAERNLPKEEVLQVLESALTSAYKKQVASLEADIFVKIDPFDSKIRIYSHKAVVKAVSDPEQEISLKQARKLRASAKTGETVEVEYTPQTTGRITIQSVKQSILQQLREAERHVVYGEFASREGEIVSGVIYLIEPTQIYVKINRTEALFPSSEQIPNERYYRRQRLKFYLLKVDRDAKGPQIIVSRSHPNLVRRFFELEIPEVQSGVVEIKAITREAGQRSKVAVATTQEGVDPVGSCLGTRSIRLQSIVDELSGEKIDVVQWHPDPNIFIANALGPAQITTIHTSEIEKTATVIVPDKQLSLAIGKGGQNARLAAKLTGWRIDIKSDTAAEAEKSLQRVALKEEVEPPAGIEEASLPSILPEEEPSLLPAIEEPVITEGEIAAVTSSEEPAPEETPLPEKEEKGQIRFAEDIFPLRANIEKQGKGKSAERGKSRKKRPKRAAFQAEESTREDVAKNDALEE